MDKYGVVGNPITQSLSPQIHAAFALQTGQKLTYEKHLIAIETFEAVIKNFQQQGYKGLNITIPFKERAIALCDELSTRAKLAGAVNTLTFRENQKIAGDNTDGLGLIRDIMVNNQFVLKDKTILLIGAGGAARGVVQPLLDTKPRSLTITNRTFAKAECLASEFSQLLNVKIQSQAFNQLDHPFDCIINATAMGLEEFEFPLSSKIIYSQSCCYDMVYNKQTHFLIWAKQNKAGLILDGLGMLVEQAAESFYIWRGIKPDTAVVLQELRKNLQ